jgi:hypothetical protein
MAADVRERCYMNGKGTLFFQVTLSSDALKKALKDPSDVVDALRKAASKESVAAARKRAASRGGEDSE